MHSDIAARPPDEAPQRVDNVSVVGARVRAQRRQLRLTQAQAAALSGVGTRFLSELERGKATVELGKVLRVLSSLGLDAWLAPRRQRSHVGAGVRAEP